MGPLVICTLCCTDDSWMRDVGISDSKALTKDKRQGLVGSIQERCTYSILEIPAEAIDRARTKMTMNRLEVIGFASTITSLVNCESSIHPELDRTCKMELVGGEDSGGPVYLDAADVNEDRFGSEVLNSIRQMDPSLDLEIVSKHKSDRDIPVVGAASILAKVRRDRRMVEISELMATEVGSGYPGDPNTQRFIMDWVKRKGELPPFTRNSWETAKRALIWRTQRTLDIFS